MKIFQDTKVILIITFISVINLECAISQPLSLNPQNPHYFLYHGKTVVLIGSTEHYGAVMNLDFNYAKYLSEIASSGLNVTRTFSGIYVEPSGAFGIEKNTLAPNPGRFICPWSRSSEPGYINGGNKFDLTKWNDAYFSRLKAFIIEAGKKNIIVELDLFSNFYDSLKWKYSPLYIDNNINGIGKIKDEKEVLSLRHKELIDVQEAMVKKIVNELSDFDNLYYEICNEPYFGDTLALREWEHHMTGVVADAEKSFSKKHLISNNVANNFFLLPAPREWVSIYNFHYARPPETVSVNYHLNKAIGDNETGFDGLKDETYRREAWDFIHSGGALFNNLDYSFAAGYEDGTFTVSASQPGGGGKTLRNQLKILAEFIKGIDYINMKPVNTANEKLVRPENLIPHALMEADKFLAVYVHPKDYSRCAEFEIMIMKGSYKLKMINPVTGQKQTTVIKGHPGGWMKISVPWNSGDIALLFEHI